MTSTDQYDAVIARIQRTVAALNADLGLSTEFDEHFRRTCVAFGYIGNCGPRRPDGTYANDDRIWSVYLPHPGRVGTADDSIGYFRTGDLDGAKATLVALAAFRRGVNWQRPAVV
jgi:hypothetical protein